MDCQNVKIRILCTNTLDASSRRATRHSAHSRKLQLLVVQAFEVLHEVLNSLLVAFLTLLLLLEQLAFPKSLLALRECKRRWGLLRRLRATPILRATCACCFFRRRCALFFSLCGSTTSSSILSGLTWDCFLFLFRRYCRQPSSPPRPRLDVDIHVFLQSQTAHHTFE